jgi:hypothetical protein
MIPIYHEVMNLIHLYRGGGAGKHYKVFTKFHQFEKTRYGFRKREHRNPSFKNPSHHDRSENLPILYNDASPLASFG